MWTRMLLLSVPQPRHEGVWDRRIGDRNTYGQEGVWTIRHYICRRRHPRGRLSRAIRLHVRALMSLYNTAAFSGNDEETRQLLRHLKPNGIFIFAYGSNFSSKRSSTWRCHSLRDVQDHFRRYPEAEIFFSTKIDTWLLRKYAFTRLVTRLNILLSEVLG